MSFALDDDELQELCRNSKDRAERLRHIKTYRQGLIQDIFEDMLNPSISREQLAHKYGMEIV